MPIETTILPSELISTTDVIGIPSAMPTSFWDRSLKKRDYIIIGAGIIGLSTALKIKEKDDPTASVLILEQGVLPKGASTRNAGFTCFGSLTEILDDISKMGEAKAYAQVCDRWHGLQLLRQSLGDSTIGFKQTGNYELITEDLLPHLKEIKKINDLLRPLFHEDVFHIVTEKIDTFGFSKDYVKALVWNKFEGELDSGKMMEALRKKAQGLGVEIRYGSKASRPTNIPNGAEVSVQQGDNIIKFQAKAVAVCINGYSSELYPEFEIKPGRGQIAVTASSENPLKIDAPCHLAEGYWYFRLLDGKRILIGGGRNLDFEGETTTQLNTTPKIMGPIKKILEKLIAPGKKFNFEYAWAGLMGFSPHHQPIIQVVPGQPNVVFGFACNGMGVARGSDAGEKTAGLLLEIMKKYRCIPAVENIVYPMVSAAIRSCL